MKVVVYTENIIKNIEKAQTLTNVPISLMFKNFYEDIYPRIAEKVNNKVFGLHLPNSICYSIGKATKDNCGAIVTTALDGFRYAVDMGIKHLYIPINANDNREGLSIYEAEKLVETIRYIKNDVHVYGLITSGCLNEKCPSEEFLYHIWRELCHCIESISLGGSFWLGQDLKLPDFISDIRIGEYMLFGTIPYSDSITGLRYKGSNGIELHTNVIGIYPERNQLILDCGYSMADMNDCMRCGNVRLGYVNSSSEYTIMECQNVSDFRLGDVVKFIPNYKSLVKLRYAEHEYK